MSDQTRRNTQLATKLSTLVLGRRNYIRRTPASTALRPVFSHLEQRTVHLGSYFAQRDRLFRSIVTAA